MSMSTSSLTLYYANPKANIQIKQTMLEGELKPTEILIATSALEISHLDEQIKRFSTIYRTKFLGRSFCGVVVASGKLTGYKVGDRICGYLKAVTLDFVGSKAILDTTKHTVFLAPPYLSDSQAATFAPAYTMAWELAVNRAPNLKKGDKVLVIGGDLPIGSLVVQLLQDLYCLDRIVVSCRTDEIDGVHQLGITDIVPVEKGLSDALVETVGGEAKFTAIFDCMGGHDVLRVWPSILKTREQGGRYITTRSNISFLNTRPGSTLFFNLQYVPRTVARLVLGRLIGIEYQFVALTAFDKPGSDYAHANELHLREPRVWDINEVCSAYEYLQSLSSEGSVVIDMTATPRDVQEYGLDCLEKQNKYRGRWEQPIAAGRAIFRKSYIALADGQEGEVPNLDTESIPPMNESANTSKSSSSGSCTAASSPDLANTPTPAPISDNKEVKANKMRIWVENIRGKVTRLQERRVSSRSDHDESVVKLATAAIAPIRTLDIIVAPLGLK